MTGVLLFSIMAAKSVHLMSSEDERELFLWRWKDVDRGDISMYHTYAV